jgi:MFS family permease
MAYSLGMLGGPLLAGVIYQQINFQWLMIVYAIILAVFGPVILAMDALHRFRTPALPVLPVHERDESPEPILP